MSKPQDTPFTTTPRGGPGTDRWPSWADTFLRELAATANVSGSARAAGIDRGGAYDLRNNSPEFRAAWEDAIEEATDALEAEARRRAIEGVERYVIGKGEVVMHPETGLPLKIREHSDTLMQTLLRAHRPEKFRDNSRVEHAGGVNVVTTLADLLKAAKPAGDGSTDGGPG